MKLPRAILFDHDGVLAASEPLHWAAWGSLLGEMGLPYVEADVRTQVGKTGPEIIAALLDRYKPGWSADEHDVHELAWRKNDYYLATVNSALRTFPGVIEGLQWLREQGVRAAIVSNAKSRELEAAVECLGLRPWVDHVISRDAMPAPKPDPAAYLYGAALLGVPPHECIAVEDSPPGIESALMGKIPAAAILSNFPRHVMEQPVLGRPDLKPVWIGDTIEEFFEWLKELSSRESHSAGMHISPARPSRRT